MKNKDDKTTKAMREKVTPAQFFLTQVRIIKELYHEYKFQTIAIIVFSCITSIGVSFIELKFLEYATNSITDYIIGKASITIERIIVGFTLFLTALLVMKILSTIYSIISLKYQSNVSFYAEKKITYKLSDIPYELYESQDFYEKINLARQASGQYSNAVYGITQIFNIIVMLSVYSVMLSRLNILFLIFIFVSILVSIILSTRVTDKQLDYWRINVSPISRRTDYFLKIFNNRINHQNIQINRCLPFFLANYSKNNQKKSKNYRKLNMLSFVSEIAATLLFGVTFIVTALNVGRGVTTGVYDIGYFTMVIALLFNLFSYLKQFSMFLNNKNWYIKVLQAYYEILDSKIETANIDLEENHTDTIVLENIAYKYPQSDKWAIKSINASFSPKKKIAVVGVNGSGKTTLISIILSLLNSYDGNYYGSGLRKTAILQDFCQYQMTIRQNIEMGCEGRTLTDEKAQNILQLVGLFDYVSSLPDGIDTMLGQMQDGVELSKGQWQRLAIARLLANDDAKIWILDEPTAYLDPIAEVEVYNKIWQLSGDRLVFFISHRLGFAKNADYIIVIENGCIAEFGTHKELIRKDGSYAKMFSAQKEWYI